MRQLYYARTVRRYVGRLSNEFRLYSVEARRRLEAAEFLRNEPRELDRLQIGIARRRSPAVRLATSACPRRSGTRSPANSCRSRAPPRTAAENTAARRRRCAACGRDTRRADARRRRTRRSDTARCPTRERIRATRAAAACVPRRAAASRDARARSAVFVAALSSLRYTDAACSAENAGRALSDTFTPKCSESIAERLAAICDLPLHGRDRIGRPHRDSILAQRASRLRAARRALRDSIFLARRASAV